LFCNQKTWKKVVVLLAGSFANIATAFLVIIVFMFSTSTGFQGTTLVDVYDNLPSAGIAELQAGDRIVAINGHRVFYRDDFNLFTQINGDELNVLTLNRNGQIIDYVSRVWEIDGVERARYNIEFNVIEANFVETIKYSFYTSFSFVRAVPLSLNMLFVTQTAGIDDLVGPVGIVDLMNDTATQAPTVGASLVSILFMGAFIATNIAVVNLLPVPAMDGGRILFIFITKGIEKATNKKLSPRYELAINTATFILLFMLMAVIMFNDIVKIFN
jgi:regulator of sigma E protease